MIKANYIRHTVEGFEEFEDDELMVAANYLMNGTMECHFSMVNITNEEGDVLMTCDEIFEVT
jgi:hypothetical protein